MSEEQKPELPTAEFNEADNPDLDKSVDSGNELKAWFVDYVGRKHQPEDNEVTVAMIVNTFAEEFPEFLMVVAEENWIRGYRQGVHDAEAGVRAALEQAGVEPQVAAELSKIEIIENGEAPAEEPASEEQQEAGDE